MEDGARLFALFLSAALSVAAAQGPAVVGIILALLSSVVFRETEPYENPSTCVLANIAQMQLLATCASSLFHLSSLFAHDDFLRSGGLYAPY